MKFNQIKSVNVYMDVTLRHFRVTNYFHGKAVSITYSECVSVALVIQYSMRTRPIFICALSGSTKFFPLYLINDKIFEKKVVLLNVSCEFHYSFYLKQELSEMRSKMYRVAHEMSYH